MDVASSLVEQTLSGILDAAAGPVLTQSRGDLEDQMDKVMLV